MLTKIFGGNKQRSPSSPVNTESQQKSKTQTQSSSKPKETQERQKSSASYATRPLSTLPIIPNDLQPFSTPIYTKISGVFQFGPFIVFSVDRFSHAQVPVNNDRVMPDTTITTVFQVTLTPSTTTTNSDEINFKSYMTTDKDLHNIMMGSQIELEVDGTISEMMRGILRLHLCTSSYLFFVVTQSTLKDCPKGTSPQRVVSNSFENFINEVATLIQRVDKAFQNSSQISIDFPNIIFAFHNVDNVRLKALDTFIKESLGRRIPKLSIQIVKLKSTINWRDVRTYNPIIDLLNHVMEKYAMERKHKLFSLSPGCREYTQSLQNLVEHLTKCLNMSLRPDMTQEDIYMNIMAETSYHINSLRSTCFNMETLFNHRMNELQLAMRELEVDLKKNIMVKDHEISNLNTEVAHLKKYLPEDDGDRQPNVGTEKSNNIVRTRTESIAVRNVRAEIAHSKFCKLINEKTSVQMLPLFNKEEEDWIDELFNPKPTTETPILNPHPRIHAIDARKAMEEAKSSRRFRIKMYNDGGKYEGEYSENSRDGIGAYYYPSGNIYVGQWKEGSRQGYGLYDYADGNKYCGEWLKDQRHGQGTSWFVDGGIYSGDYNDGKRTGYGTYTYPSGNQYVGSWLDGIRTGEGIYKYANGEVYKGFWDKDLRCGFGILNRLDGLVYTGNWKDGAENGFGKLEGTNEIFEGTFVNGLKEGEGVLAFKTRGIGEDVAEFKGKWQNDKYEGQFVIKLRSGDVINCTFRNGILISVEERQICLFKRILFFTVIGGQNRFSDIDIF